MWPFRVGCEWVCPAQRAIADLAGGLAPATIHWEGGYGRYAVLRLPQCLQRFLHPEPERADNPGADHGYAGATLAAGRRGKMRHFGEALGCPDYSCVRWKNPLLITPKRKR